MTKVLYNLICYMRYQIYITVSRYLYTRNVYSDHYNARVKYTINILKQLKSIIRDIKLNLIKNFFF